MNTDKKGIRVLAEACVRKGIRKVVFSPGSRSAPLVIAFSQMEEIECLVIPDERVAGYFALGMAQQLQQPVALVCTSGTAVLNYGPAIAEAFYQQIPLLALTADRPAGAAQKGENQAIEQAFVFEKLSNGSFDINGDAATTEELRQTAIDMELAIEKTTYPIPGPVHVNIRLSEPLYNMAEKESENFMYPFTAQSEIAHSENKAAITKLGRQLNSAARKMIIVGLRHPEELFEQKLQQLAQRSDTVVLYETASNVVLNEGVYNYDAALTLLADNGPDYKPDIVITLGNQVISKRLRQFLRKYKPASHWDISPYGTRGHDLFDAGAVKDFITEKEALNCLLQSAEPDSNYNQQWQELNQKANAITGSYLANVEFSDFKVFETLAKTYPVGANIQYGNSSPVRYANFFEHDATLQINSNRGASGIDGCVSTAAGACYATGQPTVCVVGDISFLYDSNALWNNYLRPNLRIIVINNSGGNIFRLIDGPTRVQGFEKFFETGHNLRCANLASMYGLAYYFCDSQQGLDEALRTFYNEQGKPALLEIKTNNELSAAVYKGYFDLLRQ
ncbi:MAG TPA: 2-succinyl-5-enolpyruvyl-6-hydroxy-3-cyclohexene-1-carboxylic-acid synthase [Chitinophagales bacterium]|nr:2-succinyl-5-enolpyruvyl-6-hydroxy-3-cyclohexene-1-carboxylic-acid synthase [Chitinophagales bacterium]